MNKKFILFDFDGVIVDSYAPALESQRAMCPHLTENDYKKRFEGNINDYESPANVHTPECRLDLNFFDLYLPKLESVPLVPGMSEVLAELAKEYTLVVISSTISAPIQQLLDKFGLGGYFVEVMGNDVHKSKVEKIKMVFEKYGVTATDCVFITDTLGDIREAANMQVGSVGVAWGFHTIETLKNGSPYAIISSPAEIPATFKNYFAQ